MHEETSCDGAIVGAGRAGLPAAIKLKQLDADLSVVMLEMEAKVGVHILSGVVLNLVGLNALLPDWRNMDAPIKVSVREDNFHMLRGAEQVRIPNRPMPPLMSNYGDYIVCMANVCRWMAGVAEWLGAEIFPGMAFSELVYEDDTVVGVVARELRHDPDPLGVSTQIDPVVSERQLAGNLDYERITTDEGCTVVGGQRLNRPGTFLSPALFFGATNLMRSGREEIFGPCASIIRVSGFDEALAVANDKPFGLSLGICTCSLRHATAFRRGSKAGMVMVNLPTAGVDYHVPFEGRGASGLGGREQGRIAMDFYTAVKTAYVFAG